MKQRIEALKDLSHTLATLNISRNAKLWELEFLKNPNEEILIQIEQKDAELYSALLAEEEAKNLIKIKKDELKVKIKDKSAKLEDVVALLEVLLEE